MAEPPIRPRIMAEGQAYYDEPVIVKPKEVSLLANAVAHCFNTHAEVKARRQPAIQTAWQRVNLNWVKPQKKKELEHP